MAGIDREGCEDGKDIALEKFASPGDLGFVQQLNRAKVNALLG